MKGIAMKLPVSKKAFLFGFALFALGTAIGSLVVYRYQIHERSSQVHSNAPAPPQQPTPPVLAPTAAMPGMPGMGGPKDTGQGNQTASAPSAQTMVPGTVMLNPASQQMIGVRYAEVRRADMKRTLRTVGLVQMDEEKISRVHVKIAGWIEKVDLDYVGKLIKKGQPLFTLYSPDLVSTEQEYLIALEGQEL